VNGLLGKLGIAHQGFFNDPNQALYAIVGITVWGWLGFGVIIYLAALQGIPRELVEAAQVDGATRWRTFKRVELPLLGPATVFLLVWLTINALQLFDEINVTTQGGPVHASTVVVYYLYEQAFRLFHAGYATAIAYVVFLAILVLTSIQLWASRRVVHYSS
jgi:multiple sugar transport system permease protein